MRRDGWCDDPASLFYNAWVPAGAPVSHETLARTDGLYEWVMMTDHNQMPRVRGRGSAIFVHVARPGLTPTAGCLAFPRAEWQRGRVGAGPYLVGVDPRPVRRRATGSRRNGHAR